MDAITDTATHTVVVMKSAQVGWTEILLNTIGYFVDQDPAPMLVMQPTLDMAESFSKDRLATMVRDSAALREKIKDARSRDSGNTLLHKQFPGGHVTIAGANSPSSLASRPVRILLCDEVDRYPASAGTEGDPITLGTKRTATFWNRKRLIGSTPTIKGVSRIEIAYESSDQRQFQVPCPHCDSLQLLEWKNLQWDKTDSGEPKDQHVFMACVHCGGVIEERHKLGMISAGVWIAEAEFNGTAGFKINELYSPWRSWREVRDDFLAAKDDKEMLKAWVNTSLGETWEEQGESIDQHALSRRREIYPADVPRDALLLTAGVDVQKDRLECEVVGWAKNSESWSIDFKQFFGNPEQTDVWRQLDEYLLKPWDHEGGGQLRVVAACIDSGYAAQGVYAYCATRYSRGVFAIKGIAGAGRPVAKRGDPGDIRGPKPPRIFMLGVDDIKGTLQSFFSAEPGQSGFCHWPDTASDDYFEQLTAEKRVTKFYKGYPRLEWIKTRKRNEALDCRVYAYAALTILNPQWPAIEAKLNKPAPVPQPAQISIPIPRQQPRGNFVQGWRR